jgi:hypothetical protein
MQRSHLALASAAVLILLLTSTAVGQIGTGFTYQGQLNDGGVGVNATTARVLYRLWDAETGGTQIGTDYVVHPVVITEGIFTTIVDFGGSAFTGEGRWLEIGVDTAGGTTYTWLTPRQKVTAAPTALYSPPWLMDLDGSNGIYYQAGNVGIGTDTATYPLEVRSLTAIRAIYGSAGGAIGAGVYGAATGTTSNGVYGTSNASDGRGVSGYAGHGTGVVRGVFGTVRSPAGFGVYGANTASTGSSVGVYGEVTSPTGFAGYFSGRGYFSDRLGIGTLSPTTELDVAGTVSATGLKLTTSPLAGYVLTSDASGLGSWQAPTGGGIGGSGSPSYLPKFATATTLGNSGIYEATGGNIGIGTTTPTAKLQIIGTLRTDSFLLPTSPHSGYVLTSDAGGMGTWQAAAGSIGGSGSSGYHARFTASTTLGSSVVYETTDGNIGIGTTAPGAKLHVLGTVKAQGFNLFTNPTAGYVLTSDGSGTGTWQASTGSSFWNACTGGISYTAGTVGIGTTTPSTQYALDVVTSPTKPYGISASGGNTGITGEGSSYGVTGTSGSCGVKGTGTGSGIGVSGISTSNVGVKAQSTSSGGLWAYGGGTSSMGAAVYASNSNSNGIGIWSTCTSIDANFVAVNKGTGDLIKGFTGTNGENCVFRVENSGKTSVSVLQITGGADLSEQFDVRPTATEIRPGMVVCIDPDRPGKLMVSTASYDRTVAGVISGAGGVQPGMLMGQRGSVADGSQPVALTGRVYVHADASQGAIRPGDLLTTSDMPGHAMKVTDHERARGAILGKAMTALSEGTWLVLVLVSLQ